MIKFYGIETETGSWYLVEDHTHLLGKPTWFMWFGGVKHNVNFLHLKGMAMMNSQWKEVLAEIPNHTQQAMIYMRRGGGITPSYDIGSINDFIGHMVLFSLTKGSHMDILRNKAYSNTNFIKSFVQFK